MLFKSISPFLINSGKKSRVQSILNVLCFHRVLGEADLFRPQCPNVTQFRQKLRVYKQFAEFLPLKEAVEAVLIHKRPGLFAAVTFDDGYKDNVSVALPILTAEGIRPTFFIASGFVGGEMMFNDLIDESIRTTNSPTLRLEEFFKYPLDLGGFPQKIQAAETVNQTIKYLSPDKRDLVAKHVAKLLGYTKNADLILSRRELADASTKACDLGGHTHRHLIASTVSNELFSSDVKINRDLLEEITQRPVSMFAYPNGKASRDFNLGHERIVEESGYTYAFSTEQRLIFSNDSPFALPRFSPWSENKWMILRQVIQGIRNV